VLSFWEKNSFLSYDYIIVGSGILGLSTACEIKENFPEKEILVLERGIFPTGASTKNAGFLCFGSLTEILADIKLKGEDNAIRLVEKRWKGINLLKQRLAENKIGYLNYGGYELIDDTYSSALEKIDYVTELLRDIFRERAFEVKDESINEFGFDKNTVKSIVYSPYEAQIDTGEMMKTLLKYAKFLGVQIINGCDVKEVYGNSVRANHIVLNEEVTFTAGSIIICANAFTKKLIPGMKITPGRGEVIITKPIDGLKLKGIFHYDEGYYYFRNYGKRVILGGGRNLDFTGEETTEFEFNEKIINDLKSKLDNMILPGVKYEIEDMWTGIMGFTENKLPQIQKIEDNIIAAISCNGMGIALSSYIAREIVSNIH
jgi:glycine/D-amino acid oxidase-like deaminating enzyme